MKRELVPAQLWILFLCLFGFAQNVLAADPGKIAGKVTDKKTGEALIGVTVVIQGSAKGAVTDVEGRYIISVDAGTYTVDFKYMGYQTKSISEVAVKAGAATTLDVIMDEPSSKALQEVVVTASARKESLNALLAYQKNTNTVAQVVSSETIKRSPDKNTSEVLKRVSGASIQEGKFLIVRGLADRYNQATLNGALLSSTEPDRKTFSFDIFPSNIIDNIIINKAAIPEMPGEFAGGLVQVNTKDVPDDNFFTVTVGTNLNSQTTGKDYYKYKGGNLDFLGIDDGDRKLNSNFPPLANYNGLSLDQKGAAAKLLSSNWGASNSNPPINGNLQVAGGFTSKGSNSNKKLGGIFALNYNKTGRYVKAERALFQVADGRKYYDFNDDVYVDNVLAGALANLTFQSGVNKLSWKNSYNITSSDQTLLRTGQRFDADTFNVRSQELYFKSNRLLNSQLIGDHFFKSSNIKVRWNGNFSYLVQNIPDLRRLVYNSTDGPNGTYFVKAGVGENSGSPINAGRFYSKLDEKVYGGGLDVAKNFKWLNQQQQIKAGGLYQRKNRTFTSRAIALTALESTYTNNPALYQLPPDKIFAPENLGADKFFYFDPTEPTDSYTSSSNLGAGYLQFDNQFGEKLRLVWGVRAEIFSQQLKSDNKTSYDQSNTDILPSVNITYQLNPKTNLRLSGSQTVARPEFREVASFRFFDNDKVGVVYGNPDLKRSKITNADLRYELYPAAGEVLTLGVFYKHFDRPIESTYTVNSGTPTFSYANAKTARSLGAELEFRKKLDFFGSALLEKFTLFSNVAVINSKVQYPADYVGELESRPMQGQSPFVINGGLQFENAVSGTNATVLFNMIGRRVYQVGNADFPSIWEAPRPLLDFQVSQRLFKNAEIKFTVSDIINKKAIFYQDMNENKHYDEAGDYKAFQFRYGTNYGLSFTYSF